MKITIITVNLNGNRFLAESIESVLRQTHQDLELLIIDGGSSDGSLATIQAVAERDARVSWISEPDRGIADAMNKGIALATGELVAFLHSDDRYPDMDTLSTVSSYLSGQPEVLWLTGGLELINSAGQVFKSFSVRKYSYRSLVRSNILFHPATFVRTKTIRKCGMFDPDLKLAMDYDLWLRLGALGDPVLLKCPLACFRVHDGSVSIQGADEALAEEFFIRLRYLRERGRSVWFYSCHHLIKRILNAFFVRRLRQSSTRVRGHA